MPRNLRLLKSLNLKKVAKEKLYFFVVVKVIIDLGDYAVLDGRARWYMLTEHTDSPEAYLERVHLIQRRREAQMFSTGESPLSVRKARSHSDLEKTRFEILSTYFFITTIITRKKKGFATIN